MHMNLNRRSWRPSPIRIGEDRWPPAAVVADLPGNGNRPDTSSFHGSLSISHPTKQATDATSSDDARIWCSSHA